jgi:hypothetical protein
MLDPNAGELTIASIPLQLGPGFTRDELLALPLASHTQVANEPHHSYMIGAHEIAGLTFIITLYFYGQQLESISLAHIAKEFGTSWDDWSEEQELQRKAVHDRWLIEQTGQASHVYPWGEIGSDYDPRSGGSSITIRYSWQGRPWPTRWAKLHNAAGMLRDWLRGLQR